MDFCFWVTRHTFDNLHFGSCRFISKSARETWSSGMYVASNLLLGSYGKDSHTKTIQRYHTLNTVETKITKLTALEADAAPGPPLSRTLLCVHTA